jgi:hypothetical protein
MREGRQIAASNPTARVIRHGRSQLNHCQNSGCGNSGHPLTNRDRIGFKGVRRQRARHHEAVFAGASPCATMKWGWRRRSSESCAWRARAQGSGGSHANSHPLPNSLVNGNLLPKAGRPQNNDAAQVRRTWLNEPTEETSSPLPPAVIWNSYAVPPAPWLLPVPSCRSRAVPGHPSARGPLHRLQHSPDPPTAHAA